MGRKSRKVFPLPLEGESPTPPPSDEPVYNISYGKDNTLRWDPPAKSPELAAALSYHFPMEDGIKNKMKAAMKLFLSKSTRGARQSNTLNNRKHVKCKQQPEKVRNGVFTSSVSSRTDIKAPTDQLDWIEESKIPPKKPKQALDCLTQQQPPLILDTSAEDFVSHSVNGSPNNPVLPEHKSMLARYGIYAQDYSSPYSSYASGSTTFSSSLCTAGPSVSSCSSVLDAKTMMEVVPKRIKRKLGEAERIEIRENRGSACDYHRGHKKKCPITCSNNKRNIPVPPNLNPTRENQPDDSSTQLARDKTSLIKGKHVVLGYGDLFDAIDYEEDSEFDGYGQRIKPTDVLEPHAEAQVKDKGRENDGAESQPYFLEDPSESDVSLWNSVSATSVQDQGRENDMAESQPYFREDPSESDVSLWSSVSAASVQGQSMIPRTVAGGLDKVVFDFGHIEPITNFNYFPENYRLAWYPNPNNLLTETLGALDENGASGDEDEEGKEGDGGQSGDKSAQDKDYYGDWGMNYEGSNEDDLGHFGTDNPGTDGGYPKYGGGYHSIAVMEKGQRICKKCRIVKVSGIVSVSGSSCSNCSIATPANGLEEIESMMNKLAVL